MPQTLISSWIRNNIAHNITVLLGRHYAPNLKVTWEEWRETNQYGPGYLIRIEVQDFWQREFEDFKHVILALFRVFGVKAEEGHVRWAGHRTAKQRFMHVFWLQDVALGNDGLMRMGSFCLETVPTPFSPEGEET